MAVALQATATPPHQCEVTFGSQPAYFHLCDPRGGRLPPDAAVPEPVTLWTHSAYRELPEVAGTIARVMA